MTASGQRRVAHGIGQVVAGRGRPGVQVQHQVDQELLPVAALGGQAPRGDRARARPTSAIWSVTGGPVRRRRRCRRRSIVEIVVRPRLEITGEEWCAHSRQPVAVRRKTLVATTRPAVKPSVLSPGSSDPVRTFSEQDSTATSPATSTSTSVITNWMYGVLAMITDQDRITRARPRSGGHPGCTHRTLRAPRRRRARARPWRRCRRPRTPRSRRRWPPITAAPSDALDVPSRLRPIGPAPCAARRLGAATAGAAARTAARHPYGVRAGPDRVHPHAPDPRRGGQRADRGAGVVALEHRARACRPGRPAGGRGRTCGRRRAAPGARARPAPAGRRAGTSCARPSWRSPAPGRARPARGRARPRPARRAGRRSSATTSATTSV